MFPACAMQAGIVATGVMAGCALLGLIILSIGRKRIEYKSRIEDVEEQAFKLIEKY